MDPRDLTPTDPAGSDASADELPLPSGEGRSEADPAATTQIIARSSVIADGVMTAERLLYFISLDNEEDPLDFKVTYDLRERKDVIECVKTLVSMANSGGGYIVLGMDETKGPEQRFSALGCPEEHIAALDPTDLHNKFERYVEEALDVQVRVHRPSQHAGAPIAMLFAPPARTLPLTFKIQGEYEVVEPNGRRQMRTEFRPGEIWVRRGASCVLANARDWRRIRSDMRRAEREKWAEDLLGVTPLVQRMDRIASLLERLLASGGLGAPTGRTPSGLTSADYRLPPRELAERLTELLENDEP